MRTADPQFPPEITINGKLVTFLSDEKVTYWDKFVLSAIRSSSTEMRWCEGNCEVMDFTLASNLVSYGATPVNFDKAFDPKSTTFNLVVISNGGPS